MYQVCEKNSPITISLLFHSSIHRSNTAHCQLLNETEYNEKQWSTNGTRINLTNFPPVARWLRIKDRQMNRSVRSVEGKKKRKERKHQACASASPRGRRHAIPRTMNPSSPPSTKYTIRVYTTVWLRWQRVGFIVSSCHLIHYAKKRISELSRKIPK